MAVRVSIDLVCNCELSQAALSRSVYFAANATRARRKAIAALKTRTSVSRAQRCNSTWEKCCHFRRRCSSVAKCIQCRCAKTKTGPGKGRGSRLLLTLPAQECPLQPAAGQPQRPRFTTTGLAALANQTLGSQANLPTVASASKSRQEQSWKVPTEVQHPPRLQTFQKRRAFETLAPKPCPKGNGLLQTE